MPKKSKKTLSSSLLFSLSQRNITLAVVNNHVYTILAEVTVSSPVDVSIWPGSSRFCDVYIQSITTKGMSRIKVSDKTIYPMPVIVVAPAFEEEDTTRTNMRNSGRNVKIVPVLNRITNSRVTYLT